MRQSDLLTGREREILSLLADIANGFGLIIGDDLTRQEDVREAITAIHVLQRMIASQATARAFPAEFRLLGEVVPGFEIDPKTKERQQK